MRILDNIERETQQWLRVCEWKKRNKLETLQRERSENGTKCHHRERRKRTRSRLEINEELDNTYVPPAMKNPFKQKSEWTPTINRDLALETYVRKWTILIVYNFTKIINWPYKAIFEKNYLSSGRNERKEGIGETNFLFSLTPERHDILVLYTTKNTWTGDSGETHCIVL